MSNPPTPAVPQDLPRVTIPHLIPRLIPRRSINLVVGSSGSGKTQLILPQFASYVTDGTFLECAISPGQEREQAGAILATKTFDHMYYGIRHLGLDALCVPGVFPIEVWKYENGSHDIELLETAYASLTKQCGRPVKFLLIEGFQNLMTSGKINYSSDTRRFYSDIQGFCDRNDCSILGTVGMAKMKKGDFYQKLSEWALGSIVWSEEAQTIIGVQEMDIHLAPERRTGFRRIQIQTRYHGQKTLYAQFSEQGRLTLCQTPENAAETTQSPSFMILDEKLDTYAPGYEFDKDTFLEWGENAEISERSVERWITSRTSPEVGLLERRGSVRSAKYKKPQAQ